ncbi:right-handed parallel beta-helix repeat-containing protein [Streptosporangium sp. NPDC051023]|uniref:right-handed parallel beta-helix repeat-containing protein n=1 Tax=Streptosporangium sp. NPDC051023 TaxID=3155410 RepID=UPI0034508001
MTSNDARRGEARLPKAVRAIVAAALVLAGLGTASPASAAEVKCGDVVTSNVTLTADLTCPGTALTVGADNVVIDLAGHTVSSDGSGNGTIDIGNRRNAVIDNGAVYGSPNAIYSRGRGWSLATVVTITRTRLGRVFITGGGAKISGTPETCLLGAGVWAESGTMTIEGCEVRDRLLFRQVSVDIRSSRLSHGNLQLIESGGTHSGNVFDGFPISINELSGGNLFTDNVVKNAETAFYFGWPTVSNRTNTIQNNVIRNNGTGVVAKDVTGYTIKNNQFISNRRAGIDIDNSIPRDNKEWISDNVFTGNGRSPGETRTGLGGIYIRTVSTSKINLARNTGRFNAGYLIWAPPGQVVDGGGNKGPCGPTPNPDLKCE